MRIALHSFFIGLCALAFCTLPTLVLAQTGAGVGLEPAVIEDAVDPGSSHTYQVNVRNLSDTENTYYLFPRDIVGVQDGGTPVFANEGAEKTGFELSEWITLGTTEFTLPGGASRVVSFQIDVPEDASPGSHFGGVFISVEPPRLRESGASVGYEVANIISLRIAGDVLEKAQLRSFSTDNFIYGKPTVEFSALVRNEGNTLVRPKGPLEVYNMFGSQVALVTFNESEAGVFPGSEREFVLTWEDDGPGFGRYEAVLSLVYGSEGRNSTISSTVSFWILPMNIIGPAAAILTVLLLIAYASVRLYVRRTLAHHGARRVAGRRRSNQPPSAFMLVLVVMLAVSALFLIILLALFA